MRFNDVGVLVEIAIFSQKTQKTLRFLGFSFRFSLSPYYYMLGKIPMVQMHKTEQYTEFFLRLYRSRTAIYYILLYFLKTH